MDFFIKTFPAVLEEKPDTGWNIYMLYRGPCPSVQDLSIHIGVISEGTIPHPLHRHPEEELIFVLSGKIDQITKAGNLKNSRKAVRIGKDSLVYLASQQTHTLKATGPGAAVLLIFKWRGDSAQIRNNSSGDVVKDSDNQTAHLKSPLHIESPFTGHIQGQTKYLKKLEVRMVELKPGEGIGMHKDSYDLFLVLLQGELDTMGVKMKKPGVLFLKAGTPHWMRNSGRDPASYMVIEMIKE